MYASAYNAEASCLSSRNTDILCFNFLADILIVAGLCLFSQDIAEKQHENGPLEIFDVLLPESGAHYAAQMAKLSLESRGQGGPGAHMCTSSSIATASRVSSLPTHHTLCTHLSAA